MVFSSIYFLLYFLPFFLLLYFSSPVKWKNTVALLGSCFFYMWGAPQFFFVVLVALVIDFYLVRLTNLSTGKLRNGLLITNIVLNVGLLAVAKYLNFFVDNVNVVLHSFNFAGINIAQIALPIGISFITFQKLSYVMDCYQKKSKPLEKLQDYALYILLFPQLIAGPIVRFKEVADQLIDRSHNDNIDNKLSGLFRFITGLAKKVLIANTLGIFVDEIFSMPTEAINTGMAWLGVIAYSFQIYFDFSGYSDMAIGIALMLGFKFPENFNFPYISQNITEFWRRWHITLSSWMRDYLYVPLGGNRVTRRRLYFNLWVVFLLSGLWHGAAWTFIIWGVWHGLFLVLDRIFLVRYLEKIGKLPSIAFTYLIVLIGWVLFRSESFSYALLYLKRMFVFDFSLPEIYLDNKFWVVLVIASIAGFSGFIPVVEKYSVKWYESHTKILVIASQGLLTILLAWLCLSDIFASDFNPFIYFKF